MSKSEVRVAVRAVDVGYSNVKGAFGPPDGSSIETFIFPSISPLANMSGVGTQRSDVCIVNVDQVIYAVGPGAVHYTSGTDARTTAADYCATPRYKSLMLGSLFFLSQQEGLPGTLVIDQLVLGLPFSTYSKQKAHLINMAKGVHLLGAPGTSERVKVEVRDVHVMVQPHGALINYREENEASNEEDATLVVDPGGGTLDWFMVTGDQPNWNRSGAFNQSMLRCVYAITDRLDTTRSWRNQYAIVSAIDLALREGADTFKVGRNVYHMAEFKPAVDKVIGEAVSQMLESTGPLDAIGSIVFTGGAAPLFHDYMARQYPQHAAAMAIEREPVFANVKGFFLAGLQLNDLKSSALTA